MFGEDKDYSFGHFEWPTQEDFNKMKPRVKLQALTLTTLKDRSAQKNIFFGEVEIELSNG